MRQKLPPPRGWNRHLQSSVLQILSLAWDTLVSLRGWAARTSSLRVRPLAEIEDLKRELSLVGEDRCVEIKPSVSASTASESVILGCPLEIP